MSQERDDKLSVYGYRFIVILIFANSLEQTFKQTQVNSGFICIDYDNKYIDKLWSVNTFRESLKIIPFSYDNRSTSVYVITR